MEIFLVWRILLSPTDPLWHLLPRTHGSLNVSPSDFYYDNSRTVVVLTMMGSALTGLKNRMNGVSIVILSSVCALLNGTQPARRLFRVTNHH